MTHDEGAWTRTVPLAACLVIGASAFAILPGQRDAPAPELVAADIVFQSVSAGGEHSCAVAANGRAYCWGLNAEGQLGAPSRERCDWEDGLSSCSTVPLPVATELVFSTVSAGLRHTCALTVDRRAYCWGANRAGQLGDSSTKRRSAPVAVSGGLLFNAITAGADHTCAIATDGRAYCWGANRARIYGGWSVTRSGQLGRGGAERSAVPVAVAGDLTFTSLSAGAGFTCGVTQEGVAYCWGSNHSGQLGHGDTAGSIVPARVVGDVRVAEVAVGWDHACAINADGGAACWGGDADRQLGTAAADKCVDDEAHRNQRRYSPCSWKPLLLAAELRFRSISAGSQSTCGVTTAGTLVCWGRRFRGSAAPTPMGGTLTFLSASVGRIHACALSDQGRALCWGINLRGQLGTGTN